MKKKNILLLHGFNSAPGNKAEAINLYLQKHGLQDSYQLFAPELRVEPAQAISDLENFVAEHLNTELILIGTSLGGFYVNYLRAKFTTSNVVVHAINPSWKPSETLKENVNKELENHKTGVRWTFEERFLNQLQDLERFVVKELKNYKGNQYHVHLATQDELLNFDELLNYLNINAVEHQLFHYETNHRFETMEEMLERVFKI